MLVSTLRIWPDASALTKEVRWVAYVESVDKFKQTQNVDADLLHVCVAVRCGDGLDLHTGPSRLYSGMR